MSSENTNVALLVHTCDRYALLYKGFHFFFSKHWSSNINCNLYFATEELNVSLTGFKNVQSGKGEWADRLAFLLKEKIPEKYVLYLQEDMWFNRKVNPAFFNKLFEFATTNNWQQVKLHSSEVYKTFATDIFIEGFNIAKVDNGASDFLMSHQITLWEKDFLLKQLRTNEHPWRNERKGTKRLIKLNPDIYQIDYFAENGQPELNKNSNLILRSEYQTVSINGVLRGNAEPYINELMKDPEFKDYALTLDHNLKNNVTHDGKAKPRKIDFFKKVKNWLRGQ